MAGKKFIIDQDGVNRLMLASQGVLQTVSDTALAVNTEIAGIPAQISSAVRKALADAGLDETDVDLTGPLQTLADIQASVHNIGIAAQMAGAAAPTDGPAPPVADPATGVPVAVSDPVLTVAPDINNISVTPTATAASKGTDGTGSPIPPPDLPAEASAGDKADGSAPAQETTPPPGDADAKAPEQQSDNGGQ